MAESQHSYQNSVDAQKAYENNLRASTQFYNADSQLSGDERNKLANVFWNQSTWVPLGSIPFLIVGIQGPRYAAKMGWLGRGPNAGRGLSVFTGLFGLMIGSRVAQSMGYSYGQSSLSQSPNAQTAFTILGQYPPQIGLAYYRRSARDPSLAMQDPSTIDWRKEPSFPLNLAVHRTELPTGAHIPGQPGRSHRDQFPSPPRTAAAVDEDTDSSNLHTTFDSLEDHSNEGFKASSSVSSWDKVRNVNNRSESTSGGGWEAIRRGEQPRDNRSPVFIPPPVSRTAPESELESQEDFDLEVERERLGQGVADDFSESEKKWQ